MPPLARIVVVVACVVIVAAIVVVVGRGQTHGRHDAADAARLRVLVLATDAWGGDLRRLRPSDMVQGGPAGGTAPDPTLDTTAHLYAALIMQNACAPDVCVSPADPNPVVRSAADTYNYGAYAPASGTWWDPAFTADLVTGSNVSYAHLPLHGAAIEATGALPETFPLFGTRGPDGGRTCAGTVTCRWRPPSSRWSGLIATRSGAVETVDAFSWHDDNLFAFDRPSGTVDAMLAFTIGFDGATPRLQFD